MQREQVPSRDDPLLPFMRRHRGRTHEGQHGLPVRDQQSRILRVASLVAAEYAVAGQMNEAVVRRLAKNQVAARGDSAIAGLRANERRHTRAG